MPENNRNRHSKVNNREKTESAITKVDRNEEELLHSSSEDELFPVRVEEFSQQVHYQILSYHR